MTKWKTKKKRDDEADMEDLSEGVDFAEKRDRDYVKGSRPLKQNLGELLIKSLGRDPKKKR